MRNFGELDASSVTLKAYCIDYYEAPNGAKSLPTTGVSWTAAKNTCEKSGKRLCTEQEWERACKGPGNSRFPYGNGYDVETCNTVDAEGKARPLARATDFKKCRSGFKVYMLARATPRNGSPMPPVASGSPRAARRIDRTSRPAARPAAPSPPGRPRRPSATAAAPTSSEGAQLSLGATRPPRKRSSMPATAMVTRSAPRRPMT
jgi:hypothetical protein